MIEITYKHVCQLCKSQMLLETYNIGPHMPPPHPARFGVAYFDDFLCGDCARPLDEAARKRFKELEAVACE